MAVRNTLGTELNGLTNNLTGADLLNAKVLADISVLLFQERLKRGMSQKDFADLLGVSQSKVSKWESKNCNFTIETLSNLCDRLGLSLEIQFIPLRNAFKYSDIDKPWSDWHMS